MSEEPNTARSPSHSSEPSRSAPPDRASGDSTSTHRARWSADDSPTTAKNSSEKDDQTDALNVESNVVQLGHTPPVTTAAPPRAPENSGARAHWQMRLMPDALDRLRDFPRADWEHVSESHLEGK